MTCAKLAVYDPETRGATTEIGRLSVSGFDGMKDYFALQSGTPAGEVKARRKTSVLALNAGTPGHDG